MKKKENIFRRNNILKNYIHTNRMHKSNSAILKQRNINNKDNFSNEKKNNSISKKNLINNIQSINPKVYLNKGAEEKIYKANLQKIQECKAEEIEINYLNDEIRKIMMENFKMEEKIKHKLNLRFHYEKKQKLIASYINDLNNKFHNYEDTIKQYETEILKMKRENNKLSNEYDKKIEIIEVENNKLKKRINDRIELFLHQKGEIKEKTMKTKNLENEIVIQQNTIKEKVENNKKKLDELETKYDNLYRKVIDMELNCDYGSKNKVKQDLFIIEEKEKDKDNIVKFKDINKEIEECEINNNELLNELTELNKQYGEINKDYDEDKESRRHSKYSFQSTMKTTSNFETFSKVK